MLRENWKKLEEYLENQLFQRTFANQCEKRSQSFFPNGARIFILSLNFAGMKGLTYPSMWQRNWIRNFGWLTLPEGKVTEVCIYSIFTLGLYESLAYSAKQMVADADIHGSEQDEADQYHWS